MGDCERAVLGFGSLVTVVFLGVFLPEVLTEVLPGVLTGVSVFSTGFEVVLGVGLVAAFADALAGALTSFLEISEVFGVGDLLVCFAGMNAIFEAPSMICKIILHKFSTGFTLDM